MDKAIVLDCSIAISWLFNDEVNAKSEALKTKLLTTKILVPDIWTLEMANVLIFSEQKKRISEADLFAAIHYFTSLPIEIKHTTSRIFSDVIFLAREYDLTIYDTSYLELAIYENIPLATLDKKLNSAAKKAGIKTLI